MLRHIAPTELVSNLNTAPINISLLRSLLFTKSPLGIVLLNATRVAVDWLSARLAPASSDAATLQRNRARLAAACAVVFLIATTVRLLHWQDSHSSNGLGSLTHRYLNHAQQMLEGRGILFPRDYAEPTNVQLLVHPPGYSMFAAAVFRLAGNSRDALTTVQIIADGAAVVMVTIIAAELFPLAVGVLAGLLAAFSPHLARYSLFLLPDSLSALPILIAIFLIVCALKRRADRARKLPDLVSMIAAGFCIGLSCWLRSNALLLAPLVASAVWLLFERDKRTRYSLALLAATIITVSPVTIRNWVVFHRFIPLSLGAGITMIEGIGDYDKEKRFGMPVTDRDTKQKDVEWHNRPDYGRGLWKPDGIERDRYRFRRGLEVVRSNPAWFAGVMIRRAGFMLTCNSAVSEGWPWDTAHIPPVAKEPSYGHTIAIPERSQPVWTNTPEELKSSGNQLAPQAGIQLSADRQSLEVAGDASGFGDQIASAPIAVERNTDYLLLLPARLAQGRMAAKVTSGDRRIALASALIQEKEGQSRQDEFDEDEEGGDSTSEDSAKPDLETHPKDVFEMPFATGDRTEVLLIISNDGISQSRPMVHVGEPKLYLMGPTPQTWTRFIRPGVRGIQRDLYTTSRMMPLVLAGFVLLAFARRKEALLLLLVVPAYYLCVQSAFHTEYRYILTIHFFLFIASAVTLYSAGKLIAHGAVALLRR